MAKLLKLRRGTTTQHGSFTGAEGEVTVDTDKETLVVHDGSTAGGHPVAAEDMANVTAANIKGRLGSTITNTEINASAAIAGTKISPNFGSQNVVTTGNVTLSDSSAGGNNRLSFGGSGDLQVWHDGSNSYIADEGTGALRILGSAIQLKNPANNEIGLEFTENGSVDIYHDASKKLETTSTGVKVSGHIDLDDDNSVRLGNSQDFLIYHNGSHSIINDNGTGDLQLVTNQGTQITLQGGSDNMAKFIKDGAVELYHDNSKKLETASGGVSVTGNVTVSGNVSGTLANGVTATTQSASDNSTKVATTAYTDTAISNLVDSSPSTLNTLNELAAALGDDANFSTTVTNSIATKMPLSGGTFTGAVTGTTIADSKGDLRSIPANSKSSAYTLVAGDAGKAIYISSGGVTVPSSIFASGNAITIVNDSGSNQTISQGSGLSLYNTADASTGNRTLLPRGMATVWFASTATAYISGSGLE